MGGFIDKVVVVTGGNSGIGKGIAKRFVKEGARVVIFGQNQKTLDEAKKELSNQVLLVQGSVTKADDLKNLFSKTKSHFGKIDVLVANAGVSKSIPIEEVTEEDFDFIVDTNYRGLFFTVKYGLDFLNDRSSILLIASAAAHITVNSHSVYSSAKAAILKLTQNFAFDLADREIRVNSISPGFTKTPIFNQRIATDPGYIKAQEKYIPLKRMGTPEDVANAAFFLSSEEAAYITGTDLLVDGGLSASYPTLK